MGKQAGERPLRIFLAYRRSDGTEAARTLHEALAGRVLVLDDARSQPLEVYWDVRAAAVGDFQLVLRPKLRTSRALVFLSSASAAVRRPGVDYLHDELEWWLRHRRTAPIVVDVDGSGFERVPSAVRVKWPRIQLIEAAKAFHPDTPAQERERQLAGLVDQLLDGIRISKRGVQDEELERARRQNRRLFATLVAASVFAAAAGVASLRLRRALEESEERRALADIVATDLQVRQRAFHSARARLRSMPPERRHWEWAHLMLHADCSELAFRADPERVEAVACDGRRGRVLVGGARGEVTLWSADGGAWRVRLGTHGVRIAAVALLPDGDRAASADRAGRVRLWDLASGAHVEHRVHTSGITGFALAPDGTRLASSDDAGEVVVSSLEVGGLVPGTPVRGMSALCLAYCEEGRLLAGIGTDGRIRVLDTVEGKIATLEHREEEATDVALSAATGLVAVSDLRGFVALVDLATGAPAGGYRPFAPEDRSGQLLQVATAFAARVLLAADDRGRVHLWDLTTKQPIATLPGHDAAIGALEAATDGSLLVSGDDDGWVRVWRTSPFHLAGGYYEVPSGLSAFAVDPTRSSVLAGDEDGGLWRFGFDDVEPRGRGRLRRGAAATIRFDPDDGGVAVVNDWGELFVLDGSSLEERRALSREALHVARAAPLPRSDRLLVGTGGALLEPSHAVHLWEGEAGLPGEPLVGDLLPVQVLEVAPDGRLAIVATGASQESPAEGVLFEPLTGRVRWRRPLPAGAEGACFLPAARQLALGDAAGEIHLLELGGGAVARTLRGHTAGLRALDATEDGARLISAGADGTARLWALALGAELLVVHRSEQVMAGAAFADGERRIVTGAYEPRLAFWNTKPWR